MAEFKIDPDYKEVAERLRDLFAKHPQASMRGAYELVDGYVIYRAECYRTSDDPAPGVGTAWEEVPGRTPYTKGSELQNAETSAWGRAIVAVGASESKRIASADDIRLANDRRSAPPAPVHLPASPERVEKCVGLVTEKDLTDWVRAQNYRWPWSDEACHFIELYAQNLPGPNARTYDNGGIVVEGGPIEVEKDGKVLEPDAEPVMGRAESLAREATREPNLDEYDDSPF